MAAPADVLETLELWKKHAHSDEYAEQALSKYMAWKERSPYGGGVLILSGLKTLPPEIDVSSFTLFVW